MLALWQATSHYYAMNASQETLKRFIKKGGNPGEEQSSPGREQLKIVAAQVLRSSKVVSNGYRGYNNGETIEYDSRWTNIAYDAERDVITQAKLHGLYDVRAFVFPGPLACVHLYMREADADTTPLPRPYYEEKNNEYVALFSPDKPEILVPNDHYEEGKIFPLAGGEPVVPDTPTWRQLDYILGQIEARPR